VFLLHIAPWLFDGGSMAIWWRFDGGLMAVWMAVWIVVLMAISTFYGLELGGRYIRLSLG
jgi:hypothetical protein